PACRCPWPADVPAVHRGRHPERFTRGSLRRARWRGERHRAGRVPGHHQPARLVGVVRWDDCRARRADRHVAGRLAGGEAGAGRILGALGRGREMSVTRRYDATLYVDRREFLMLGAGTFLSVVASWGQATPQSPDAVVRENGIAILMAPPKRGLNLIGYVVPPVVLIVAAGILALVMRRWTRTAAPDRVPARPLAPAGTSEELERLRGELDRLSV